MHGNEIYNLVLIKTRSSNSN